MTIYSATSGHPSDGQTLNGGDKLIVFFGDSRQRGDRERRRGEIVSAGGTASATTVNFSGQDVVVSGGETDYTIVNSGGDEYVGGAWGGRGGELHHRQQRRRAGRCRKAAWRAARPQRRRPAVGLALAAPRTKPSQRRLPGCVLRWCRQRHYFDRRRAGGGGGRRLIVFRPGEQRRLGVLTVSSGGSYGAMVNGGTETISSGGVTDYGLISAGVSRVRVDRRRRQLHDGDRRQCDRVQRRRGRLRYRERRWAS